MIQKVDRRDGVIAGGVRLAPERDSVPGGFDRPAECARPLALIRRLGGGTPRPNPGAAEPFNLAFECCGR